MLGTVKLEYQLGIIIPTLYTAIEIYDKAELKGFKEVEGKVGNSTSS